MPLLLPSCPVTHARMSAHKHGWALQEQSVCLLNACTSNPPCVQVGEGHSKVVELSPAELASPYMQVRGRVKGLRQQGTSRGEEKGRRVG